MRRRIARHGRVGERVVPGVLCPHNRVFITESYGAGGVMVEIAPDFSAQVAWRAAKFSSYWMTPIAQAGHIYGFAGQQQRLAELVSLEVASGRELARGSRREISARPSARGRWRLPLPRRKRRSRLARAFAHRRQGPRQDHALSRARNLDAARAERRSALRLPEPARERRQRAAAHLLRSAGKICIPPERGLRA